LPGATPCLREGEEYNTAPQSVLRALGAHNVPVLYHCLLQSFSSPGVFVSEFGITALALASAFLA
jgi:hypothetical protein